MPAILAKSSVLVSIFCKILVTAVPPRSLLTPNSCNVADKPNTCPLLNPN